MRLAVLSVLSVPFVLSSIAAEPWADAKLPPNEALAVWLDAAAQNAARDSRKLPVPASGVIDTWFDGSGNHRDVRQALLDARPRLVGGPGGSFVRFDGKDDFLAAAPSIEMPEATVFVVAAPRVNPGFFRGFFAMNRTGQNDYTSGLNFDLGGAATPTLSALNTEVAGGTGAKNVLKTQFDFGTFHIFTLTAGADSVKLRADGKDEGSRPRTAATIAMDEFTVGARRYSHDGNPPYATSHLDGDIAELIVYRRALPDAERDAVEKYLIKKHSGLRAATAEKVPGGPRILTPVANPPPVQMFVPGFEVRELPLTMTNIDCLRYRHDGVLVAGAYNGKIWLLRDTDDDGSEDKADLYWESPDLKNVIGMALTPKGDPRGDGVFVATAGRILFIPDKNGDNRGDEQIIIANGWEKQKSPGGGGSVDALGLALAPDGSIYFGLGVSAYNNAYLLDADGKSHFDLKTERGTVQRISADFSKRETICTGIRYPVGAQFNKHGDLFMTEQEGATWLANGNPFDELVHIEKGRHYGFPPRHPKHLPDVIDEPSVFDYGPQHQSTCGFVFNEGPKTFGPDWWKGDAFVTGESRGKLYRTKLVKTAAGYVAQNQLIAALAMLPVDVTLSPRGDLIVACHSGAPDWGSGPEGAGKMFRISAAKEPAPLPVLTYFASASELRVTFDRDLDPTKLRDLAKRTEITAGRYVAAGDQYESFRPGYQVVRDQMAAPRRDVPVLGATLSADKRSISFAIPPQSVAENYAISINGGIANETGRAGILPAAPGFQPGAPTVEPSTISQTPGERIKTLEGSGRIPEPAGKIPALPVSLELATDMSGVEATWISTDGKTMWQGWLPHVDLAVSRELTAGSPEHVAALGTRDSHGTLSLRGLQSLTEMLHPAIQPGSKLDHERPVENVRVAFEGERGYSVTDLPPGTIDSMGTGAGFLTIAPTVPLSGPMSYRADVRTTGNKPRFSATWFTLEDHRMRAFPLRRFLLPFAKPADAKATEPIVLKLEGDWLNGRRLYFGKAQCATCHTTGGQGGRVGPDLSNLSFRDRASVERDIREPSAALNPDHLTYHITLKNGAELAAVILTEDKETFRIGEANGTVRDLPRSEVREVKALPVSLMPPGLLEALSPAEQNDLIKFLLSPAPLEAARIDAPNPPPARKRAEVEAVVPNQKSSIENHKSPLRILLVSAKKDHGPGEHDYPLFQKRWSTLLGLAGGVEVTTAQDWPTVEQLAKTDVAVFYSNNPAWNPDRKAELDAFLQRGGGAVFIHWAIEGREFAPELADCIGLASNSKALKYRHGALTMNFPNAEHPITRGFKATDFIDETYWLAIGDPKRITLLGDVVEDGAPRPQLWAREHGKGRVFVSIPGHYTWTFDDPLHRLLLLRGICWSARQPEDRLSELATIGARMEW